VGRLALAFQGERARHDEAEQDVGVVGGPLGWTRAAAGDLDAAVPPVAAAMPVSRDS
jgi:hypothetical protein